MITYTTLTLLLVAAFKNLKETPVPSVPLNTTSWSLAVAPLCLTTRTSNVKSCAFAMAAYITNKKVFKIFIS